MDFERLKELPVWEWPKEADKIVLDVLHDRDMATEDRAYAAYMAGDYAVVNDELGAALVDRVRDDQEDEEVRGQAAVSLGPALENAYLMEFDEPEDIMISEVLYDEIRETFRTLYRSAALPKFVRRMVLEASVRAPEDWHDDAVRTAYEAGDPEWKLTAVFCMRCIEGFEKEVIETLEGGDEGLRYQAVRAAEAFEINAAWPHIAEILEDDDPDINLILAAIDASVTVNPDGARDYLDTLMESEDEDVSDAAAEALGMIDALSEEFMDEEE